MTFVPCVALHKAPFFSMFLYVPVLTLGHFFVHPRSGPQSPLASSKTASAGPTWIGKFVYGRVLVFHVKKARSSATPRHRSLFLLCPSVVLVSHSPRPRRSTACLEWLEIPTHVHSQFYALARGIVRRFNVCAHRRQLDRALWSFDRSRLPVQIRSAQDARGGLRHSTLPNLSLSPVVERRFSSSAQDGAHHL